MQTSLHISQNLNVYYSHFILLFLSRESLLSVHQLLTKFLFHQVGSLISSLLGRRLQAIAQEYKIKSTSSHNAVYITYLSSSVSSEVAFSVFSLSCVVVLNHKIYITPPTKLHRIVLDHNLLSKITLQFFIDTVLVEPKSNFVIVVTCIM